MCRREPALERYHAISVMWTAAAPGSGGLGPLAVSTPTAAPAARRQDAVYEQAISRCAGAEGRRRCSCGKVCHPFTLGPVRQANGFLLAAAVGSVRCRRVTRRSRRRPWRSPGRNRAAGRTPGREVDTRRHQHQVVLASRCRRMPLVSAKQRAMVSVTKAWAAARSSTRGVPRSASQQGLLSAARS